MSTIIKVAFEGPQELIAGLSLVAPDLGITLTHPDHADLLVTAVEDEKSVCFYHEENGCARIVYGGGKARFFRAMAMAVAAFRGDGPKNVEEYPAFRMNGAMIDVSRNAVIRVDRMKYLMRKMALMGMNTLMLYTEDTYELPGYPYFGHMRGRYSEEELREMDEYAATLGIELIPCVQLLGHLETFLRWPDSENMKDTANVLMVDTKEAEAFVRAVLTQVRRVFRTKRIHVGMDETHDLGRGRFLDRYGYQKASELYFRHLKMVSRILEEMDFEPMMWSDMFFRLAAGEQKIELKKDYDEQIRFSADLAAMMPANMQPVFWDYYNDYEAFYADNLQKHSLFQKPAVFAGGIWCWGGFAPQFNRSLHNTLPALKACLDAGVRDVIATVWHNGAECSEVLCLPHLALWASYDYQGEYNLENCRQTLMNASGEDYDSLIQAECIEYPEPGNDRIGSSRMLIYNDPLLGLWDAHLTGIDFAAYYQKAARILSEIQVTKENALGIAVLQEAAKLLEKKADFGLRLKKAYDQKDRSALEGLLEEAEWIKKQIEKMRLTHRESWMKDNKAFGWEVHDMRYGALEMRFDTVEERLRDFLSGKISQIEELEEERRYYMKPEEGGFRLINTWNQFSRIFTPGVPG